MNPKAAPITYQTDWKKNGFGKDPGGREQRALSWDRALGPGYSLCAVRGRTALLTGEIVSHGAQVSTSAGLEPLKGLLAQAPKALEKSNWTWRIQQRL